MAEITLTIYAETPSKKNSRITLRNGRTIPNKKYMDWHKKAMLEIMAQARPQEPINEPVEIEVLFVHGDKRRRDSDNGLSSILDLLQDCGILADDCWEIVREIRVKNAYKKGEPKAEIWIKKIKYF